MPECGSIDLRLFPERQRYSCNNCGRGFEVPAKGMTSLRIFLSSGHDGNEELVRLIKAVLEKRGHNVWFDKNPEKEKGISPGDDWRRAITEGILGSNRVLSFLSKHSTRDPGVCLDEIAIAIGAKGGNIQTILVESEQEVQPPPSISHIQWLDLFLLKEQFEIPNTHCHLARLCMITDRFDNARDHVYKGWTARSEAMPYIIVRLLWFRLALEMVERYDTCEINGIIGRIKTAFHVEDAYMEWTMQPVLDHLKPRLSDDDYALLSALVAALSDKVNVEKLDAFPVWRDAVTLPLE